MQFPRLRRLCIDGVEDKYSVLTITLDQSRDEFKIAHVEEVALHPTRAGGCDLCSLAEKVKVVAGIEWFLKGREVVRRTLILFLPALVSDDDCQVASKLSTNALLHRPRGLKFLAESVARIVSPGCMTGAAPVN
jgi:hypothetical protein